MTWGTVIIILAICIVLIFFYFIAQKLGIVESDISKGQLKFSSKDKFNFRPCFFIEPVVSEDGSTYKFHLATVVSSDKKYIITNWKLEVTRLFNGIIKQYYLDDSFGNKLPNGISILKSDEDQKILGLEFVPLGDYVPFTLEQKIYKAKLTVSTEKGKFYHKFRFIVQNRNLIEYEQARKQAIKNKQAVVFKLPLLD